MVRRAENRVDVTLKTSQPKRTRITPVDIWARVDANVRPICTKDTKGAVKNLRKAARELERRAARLKAGVARDWSSAKRARAYVRNASEGTI
eukprot:1335474-Amorphochlora_amoeboformis.AAC.1